MKSPAIRQHVQGMRSAVVGLGSNDPLARVTRSASEALDAASSAFDTIAKAVNALQVPTGTVTNPTLDSYSADSSGALTLVQNSFLVVPGTTLTLTNAGTYLVCCEAEITAISGDGDCQFGLLVNNVLQSRVAHLTSIAGATLNINVAKVWRLPSLAAGAVLWIQGQKTLNGGTSSIPQATITALRVGA